MKQPRLPKRWTIYLATPAAIAVAALAWSAYWWVAAAAARDNLDRWAAARRADGWSVSYGAVRTSGFPSKIVLELERPRIEATTREGSIVWRTDTLKAQGRPWRFGRITFTTPGQNDIRRIHLPTREILVLKDDGASGEATFGAGGRLRALTVRLRDVVLRSHKTGERIAIGGLEAGIRLASNPAGTEDPPVTVTVSGLDLRLPDGVDSPLGALVARFGVEATLSPPMFPDDPIRETLESWRNAGGKMRIEDLDLRWGPLTVEARGRLALDGDLQPAGRLIVRAKGFDQTIQALAALGRIDPNDAVATRLALNFLARPGPDDGVPQITAAVSIHDRVVTAGPRTVARLPRIEWR